MLESGKLFGRQFTAKFLVFSLLQVGKEVFLGLSALIIAILFGMHGKLEKLFVILPVLPTILVHLFSEVIESILEQRMRIGIRKFSSLLFGKLHKLGRNCTGHLTALS